MCLNWAEQQLNYPLPEVWMNYIDFGPKLVSERQCAGIPTTVFSELLISNTQIFEVHDNVQSW